MLIRGEALIDTITLAFTISGKRGEWSVSITAPGGVVTSDETTEKTWHPLLTEMLAAAHDAAIKRRFPGRESASEGTAMSVEKAEADFWAALSLLLRPNDDKHNAAMISDFSKMSHGRAVWRFEGSKGNRPSCCE